jgi:hypothetical protein
MGAKFGTYTTKSKQSKDQITKLHTAKIKPYNWRRVNGRNLEAIQICRSSFRR